MDIQQENPILAKCRENLYLGSLQAVINRLTSDEVARGRAFDQNEVKVLLIRAYLSQGKFNSAISELSKMEQNDLAKAAKNLVTLSQKLNSGVSHPLMTDSTIAQAVQDTQQLIANNLNFTKPTFIVLSSLILLHVGEYEQAMKLLALHPKHIECFALMIQSYLMINRLDMAKQLLETSKLLFEESPIYNLAESWVFLYLDGKFAEKAFYAFEELATNSSNLSVKILNCEATAKMHMNQYPEADSILMEAQDKDNSNPDTLANLVLSSSLNEKESYSRLLSQLEEQHPNHALLADMNEKARLFDSLSRKFNKSSA